MSRKSNNTGTGLALLGWLGYFLQGLDEATIMDVRSTKHIKVQPPGSYHCVAGGHRTWIGTCHSAMEPNRSKIGR